MAPTPQILVGTSNGIRALGLDLPPMLRGCKIGHLLVAESGVWAVADGQRVWHDPGRGEWSPVVDVEGVQAHCLLATGARILIGGSEASLLGLTNAGVARVTAFDEAPGRNTWYTPWGGPPDIRSMATDADGTLYINVHVGGVVRSTDGGVTWIDTMDIDADAHQVIADPGRPGHAFAATARGLASTTSIADDWDFSSDGLHGSYCRAVAVTADHVFVSASLGPGGRQAALYRRTRSGGRFERCTFGLPEWFSTNLDTFCLAAGGGIVVTGDAAGTVYVSADGGATWDTAETGLPDVRCLAIVSP
jgi:hypothetical protein